MMMSLLDLPNDLLGCVVFAWLDTKSIVRLDSSVCHTGTRCKFLGFLQSEHAVIRNLPPETTSETTRSNAFQWATVRQVRSRTLTFNVGDNTAVIEKYLRTVKQPTNVHLNELEEHTAYICMMIAAHFRTMPFTMYCYNCELGSSVSNIFACCSSSIQEIFLCECDVEAEHFAGILCPHVKALAVTGCECDDECMIAAVAMCPNIVNLDISANDLTDEAVRDIVTKLPQLQKLSLYKLPVSDDTVVAVSAACALLTAIDLGYCAALTDVAVAALTMNCTHLTNIQLFGNTNYTRESLRAIAQNCSGLKYCVFSGFTGASREDEVLLLNSCRQLQSAELHLLFPASVVSISPTVTHLSLKAELTTDDMLYAVATYCKNLTKLSIVEGSPAKRVHTAKGLAAIARGCAQLRKLVLQGDAEQVSELTLLVWRNTCPQLEVVGEVDPWEYYVFRSAE